jgi:hypothetical protein
VRISRLPIGSSPSDGLSVNTNKVDVFFSWSGSLSRQLAQAFYRWVSTIPIGVKPFFSSEDIESGERWNRAIDNKLEEGSFGLLFMTTENLRAPWIFFEAGALAKSVEKARVAALLFDVQYSDLVAPMTQFQARIADREGVWKVVHDMAKDSAISLEGLERAFARGWPELETEWGELLTAAIPRPVDQEPLQPIEEVLNLCRSVDQRLTSDPGRSRTRNFLAVHGGSAQELIISAPDRATAIQALTEKSENQKVSGVWTLNADEGPIKVHIPQTKYAFSTFPSPKHVQTVMRSGPNARR